MHSSQWGAAKRESYNRIKSIAGLAIMPRKKTMSTTMNSYDDDSDGRYLKALWNFVMYLPTYLKYAGSLERDNS